MNPRQDPGLSQRAKQASRVVRQASRVVPLPRRRPPRRRRNSEIGPKPFDGDAIAPQVRKHRRCECFANANGSQKRQRGGSIRRLAAHVLLRRAKEEARSPAGRLMRISEGQRGERGGSISLKEETSLRRWGCPGPSPEGALRADAAKTRLPGESDKTPRPNVRSSRASPRKGPEDLVSVPVERVFAPKRTVSASDHARRSPR